MSPSQGPPPVSLQPQSPVRVPSISWREPLPSALRQKFAISAYQVQEISLRSSALISGGVPRCHLTPCCQIVPCKSSYLSPSRHSCVLLAPHRPRVVSHCCCMRQIPSCDPQTTTGPQKQHEIMEPLHETRRALERRSLTPIHLPRCCEADTTRVRSTTCSDGSRRLLSVVMLVGMA